MAMTGRERLLTAINNGRPDRLPCQVHCWMNYYLRTHLGGADQYQAYERFGMDIVAYVPAKEVFDEKALANWDMKTHDLGLDPDGNHLYLEEVTTPGGTLHRRYTIAPTTGWTTEYLIKDERDWEIWSKYVPVPVKMDQTPWLEARKRIGDRGLVRGLCFGFGQGSPWQDFCGAYIYGMQDAIMMTFDKRDWIHAVLEDILQKRIGVWERTGKLECDIVETGGGAGSSTVISPALHREFCLPYDRRQHAAIHEFGKTKIVYHLCGGLMPLLETVAENGVDGLETMTPPDMGGDCNLAEASRRVGERLFFIGGFDQNAGFENGTPESARRLVFECFEATKDHAGYICCPSDHFFEANPRNVQAFADACKECVY